MTDVRIKDVEDIKTTHLFDMIVGLNEPLAIGNGLFGHRVLFGASGGSFDGPRLRGTVVAGGGDWGIFRPDGGMTVDVRLTLRTDDDALIHMAYTGRWIVPQELQADIADPATRTGVDPARFYFRTAPMFETGARKYAWLNDIVCIGSGYPVNGGVGYRISQIL